MEAFLHVTQKELNKSVLTRLEFHKTKFVRLSLAIYLLATLATEIPLLLVNHNPNLDLPTYQYALRMAFLFTAIILVMLSLSEATIRKKYNNFQDILKIIIFTGILFTTSYNFSENRQTRSMFYGIPPFWEGLDVAFYLVIISVFVIKNWWNRSIFIGINFTIAVIAKNDANWGLLYIIKLSGIFLVLTLLLFALERDFKVLYLRKLHYKQEEQAWRMLIDALPEGVLVLNTNKDIMFYNKGITEFVNKVEGKEPFEKQLSKLLQETHQLKHRDPLQGSNPETRAPSSGDKDKRPLDTLALTLTTKTTTLNTKKTLTHDEREETTYSSTLWNQVYYFLENYEDCKSNNIGWNSAKEESNFLTFEGRYKERLVEIKIGFSLFDYQDSIIIILRDMSDRNTIAALEANDKYKSLVLASVSHELRTPLNNTFNMVTFAAEAEETPDEIKTQFLQPALISIKMLLGLVNDILDYSQINANKFRLVYQDIDIRKLIEETCGLMQLQAAKRNLKLLIEISDNVPSSFHTDPNRLTQIMLNLLSNSLKFTLKGYIKVKMFVKNFEYGMLEISVEDTGIGMSPEDQKNLFQDFTKINVEQNAKLNASGCGLGLAISNTLAKALARGEQDPIEVTSELGIGTKFSFKVQNKANEFYNKSRKNSHEEIKSPKLGHDKYGENTKNPRLGSEDFLQPHLDEKAKRRDEHHALKKSIVEYYRTSLDVSNNLINHSPLQSPTKISRADLDKIEPEILIVDDDPFNVLSLETIVKGLNHTYCHAYNGKEAIELITEKNSTKGSENIKLIFMDCNMPILDGFEASKILKQKMNKGEIISTKIIGCTGYDQQEYITMCLESGMDFVTTKPITKAKVDELLRRYL